MNRVGTMTNYHLKAGVKSDFKMSCLTNIPKKIDKSSIVLEGLQVTKHFR